MTSTERTERQAAQAACFTINKYADIRITVNIEYYIASYGCDNKDWV
jgi:hypothetical protein